MNNVKELHDCPGIEKFIKSHSIHKCYEAYQEIPEWEMQDLWRLVSCNGTLEHLKFIYQKKLRNTTLYESMRNFWYKCDVHGWDDIVPYVIASKDFEKLNYIISRGAFQAFIPTSEFLDEVVENFGDNDKSLLMSWMAEESKEAKDCLHQIFLSLISKDPNTKLLSETIFSNASGFITLERFMDYVNQVINAGEIEPFKKLYQYIPVDFELSNNRNNVLLKNILKHSESSAFCKLALDHMSTPENCRANGEIHSILRAFVGLNTPKNNDALKAFIIQFDNELSSRDTITEDMKLALFRNRCFRVLDNDQQRRSFVSFIQQETEDDLKTFLSEDNNLSFFYECAKETRFLKGLREQMDYSKLQSLDLPYSRCIEHLNYFQQKAYYERKSREILRYIDVNREVNQQVDVWTQEDKVFMSQANSKKQQYISLTPEEQERYNQLRELKAKPYLNYVKKGVTLSLARGLSTPSDSNNASKQMIIDTLNHCLKEQKKHVGNRAGLFGAGIHINQLTHQTFVEKLMNCGPIRELLHLSFTKHENQLLETLHDAPNLEYVLTALLDIPSFYNKGMEVDFCVRTDGVFNQNELPNLLNNEGAMFGLTRDQEKILDRVSKHYRLPMPFDHVQKRQDLKQIFVQRYRKNPLVVNGRIMPLEYSVRLTTAELHACYNHPLHSVIRYLSVPNFWISSTLLNPEIPQLATVDVQNNCAILEQDHIRLLWMFWLAASDESEEMRPCEKSVTVEQRIQAFIEGIACAGRTHNRDKTERELGWGTSNKKIDDMEPDKPTCPHGAKQQIFSSLMYHPLCTVKSMGPKTVIEEFRRNWMLQHIKAQIRLDNYQSLFKRLEDPEQGSQYYLRAFNLPNFRIAAFKEEMGKSFSNGLPPFYGKLIDHCCLKNLNRHVLTCEDELNELAENQNKLIDHFVHQILAGERYQNLRQAWGVLMENDHIGLEYQMPLANMRFAEKLESFVSTIKPGCDYKDKFNREFPGREFPETFFDALEQNLLHNPAYFDVQELLESELPGYTPYNQQEFLTQEKPITLRVLSHKLANFIENHVGITDSVVLDKLGELICHIEDKIKALSPTAQSKCRY